MSRHAGPAESPSISGKYTFANEEADLGVDELLHAVPLSSHEAEHRQEGLDVTQPPLLILQLLLLCSLVHTGEHIRLGVTEHVEEWLVLCTVPQHLGERVTISPYRGRRRPREDKSSHTRRLAMLINFLSLPSVHCVGFAETGAGPNGPYISSMGFMDDL